MLCWLVALFGCSCAFTLNSGYRYSDQVVQANNEFASDLLRQARVSTNPGNVLLSPYSVMSSLGMLTAGARGDTELEIRKTMRLKGLSSPKLARALGQLARISKEEEADYTLAVANRVWAQQDRRLDKTFIQSMADLFNAPVGRLDFQKDPETARRAVNEWVANQTRGQITELLSSGTVDSLTRLILTNAVYFQGQWVSKFKSIDTKPAKFHACDCGDSCDSRSVTMMHQNGMFNYKYEVHDSVHVLEMPYTGTNVSMFVILPDDCQALAILEKGLTGDKMKELTSGLRPTTIDVHFPRFELSYRAPLGDMLKEMGIRKAFDPSQADFSGIDNTKDLYISRAIHQATLNVNEDGTTAAAASGFVVSARTFYRPEFRANRAFMFLIMDRSTRAVLFAGRVVDPRALSGEQPLVKARFPKVKPTAARVNPPVFDRVAQDDSKRPKQCVDKCPVSRTLDPRGFCDKKYDFAIVGELVGIHELQSRLRYKFHISRVLQAGETTVRVRTDQNYLWPKNLYKRCGCGLQIGQKYIIAGHHNHKDTKMVLKMDSYVLERASIKDAIRMKSFLRACRNL